MARPCLGEGSLNCDCTFTEKAAVAWKLIYQTQTPPHILPQSLEPMYGSIPIILLTSEVETRLSTDPSFVFVFWTCPWTMVSDCRCNRIYFPILWLSAKKDSIRLEEDCWFLSICPWYKLETRTELHLCRTRAICSSSTIAQVEKLN